jgi:hypothetical protein
VKDRRVYGSVLLVVAAALAAGPSGSLLAASPCGTGAPMACCGGADTSGGDALPPCGCALKRVAPSPGVVEAAAFPLVLSEARVHEMPVPGFTSAVFGTEVPPRVRAGPLFLLHSALLV